MSKKVAILIPTYGRPAKIQTLVDNIKERTNMDLAEIVFIVEDDDLPTKEACIASGEKTIINLRSRNYAGAINTAVKQLDNEYFFAVADDFRFYENWLPPLLNLGEKYGVVGPNDLGNPQVQAGQLAVIYLVAKRYLPYCVVDSPGDMLHEGYLHNFPDTEITETAIWRGEYAYCPESIVEHMHPDFGKAERDSTYQKQIGTWQHDESLFLSRRHLWGR